MPSDREPEKDRTTIFMQGRFPTLLICLLLAAAILAVYWPVRNYDFINLDDPTYVTENGHVQAGLTRENFIWALTATDAANWHPLTWISLMLDSELYGLNPAGHHLTSVFFHLANTLLLFLVLKLMTGAFWRSALVAALFALHPLHVESVAWVAERKDVLSTFFWIFTLWAYLGYVQRPGVRRYLLILLLFALGLMAKPMLVTLPCVLLLLDFWPLERIQLGQASSSRTALGPSAVIAKTPRRQAFRLLLEKTPLFVLAAVSAFVTFVVQKSGGAVGALEVYPIKIRVANALVSYVRYMVKMIWPQNLAFFYPHPGQSLPMGQAAAAGLLLLLISIAVIRAGRRQPYLPVGWLWYLGTLVPVIGLVQVGEQAMADRYTYVPLIGLFIMAAWGVPELTRGWRYGRIVLRMAAGSLLAALMVCTWMQLRHWRNNETLFKHALNTTANNYLAHDSLGNTLAQQGKIGEAIGHYSAALRIKPDYMNSHTNLGIALLQRGDVEQAIAHFSTVLRYQSDSPEAHNNLGLAVARQGYVDRAIDHYFTAVRLKPDYPQAYNNLGNALASQGKFDQAINHYSEALRIKPEYAEAHSNLANVLASKGRFKEAIDHYSQALQIKPDNFEAHNNLGVVLADQGKFNEAIDHYSEALRIRPDDANAHNGLAVALEKQGRIEEAIDHYYEALRIEPNNTITHIQLALVWLSQERTDKAIEHYQKALSLSPDSTVVLNNLAWILATHENSNFRDGARAVKLAEKACTLTGYKNAVSLDTLAAAYAEAGRFHEALQAAQKASKLAVAEGRVELAKEIERRMQLYKAGKPFYES